MKTMSFGNPHVISAGLVVTLLTGLSALSITDVSLPASPITYKHELGRKLGVGDDIVLTRHLLWADEVSNAAQCAMKCLEHQGCLEFWFREPDVEVGTTVSLGKCRAHSTLCDDQLVCPVPANTTALGFRFYGFLGKAARECGGLFVRDCFSCLFQLSLDKAARECVGLFVRDCFSCSSTRLHVSVLVFLCETVSAVA